MTTINNVYQIDEARQELDQRRNLFKLETEWSTKFLLEMEKFSLSLKESSAIGKSFQLSMKKVGKDLSESTSSFDVDLGKAMCEVYPLYEQMLEFMGAMSEVMQSVNSSVTSHFEKFNVKTQMQTTEKMYKNYTNARKSVLSEMKSGYSGKVVESERLRNDYQSKYRLLQKESMLFLDCSHRKLNLTYEIKLFNIFKIFQKYYFPTAESINSKIEFFEGVKNDISAKRLEYKNLERTVAEYTRKNTAVVIVPTEDIFTPRSAKNLKSNRRKSEMRRFEKNEKKTNMNLLLLHEKNYVSQIGLVMNNYLPAFISRSSIIGEEKIQTLFSNFEFLFNLHTVLFEGIATSIEHEDSLGLFLLSNVDDIDAEYENFYRYFNKSITEYNSISESSKKMSTFLKKLSLSCHGAELGDLLRLPLTKLKQYIEDVNAIALLEQDEEEKANLHAFIYRITKTESDLSGLGKIVQTAENLKKYYEELQEMNALGIDLLNPGREFILDSPLALTNKDALISSTMKDPNQISDLIPDRGILFSDVLVLSQQNVAVIKIYLNSLEIEPQCDAGTHYFALKTPKYHYTFKCDTSDIKQKWIRYLSEAIISLISKKKIFGVELKVVFKRNQSIPSFISQTCSWLSENATDMQGLFRISAGASEMIDFQANFDCGLEVDYTDVNPHVPACLLKLWLRELPTPLIPDEYYEEVMNTMDKPKPEDRVEGLKIIIDKIPTSHAIVLNELINLLVVISSFSNTNYMTPSNLGIVIGPNIIRSEQHMANVEDSARIAMTVEYLILFSNFLMRDTRDKILEIEENKKEEEIKELETEIIKEKTISVANKRASMRQISASSALIREKKDILISDNVKSGWLKIKKGRKWHTYWFVLKYKYLSYFKNDKSVQKKGQIILHNCTVGNSTLRKYCFAINNDKGQIHFLAAENNLEKKLWAKKLASCFENDEDVDVYDEISVDESSVE